MDLPKRPNYSEYEPRIYQEWEEAGIFTPEINKNKEPYTILLPPPNANAPLHVGHALYVVEDILARYHRMKGDPTLFLPGTDHAGIETQFVLEKHLAEEGKSRFDFDRETLYQMIHEFVEENRGVATNQLRKLGFSLDWSREKYTLDPKILEIVLDTFHQMHKDGLLYRDERLVNYCTHCGTGFSNLEIDHQDRDDLIYHLNYGTITIATTRPETIFADVAIAVHPNGIHKKLVGQTAIIPLIDKEIPIIADEAVDPEFGTGALKITPGHDQTDYEVGQRHDLEKISVVSRSGKMVNVPEKYLEMSVIEARNAVVADLRLTGKLKDEKPLQHSVSVCYRCKSTIEPLLVPQWYIKIESLINPVIKALNVGESKIFPTRFEKELRRWLETAPDWNISRQIVWGPRIPVWYDMDKNPEIELTFLNKKGENVSGKYADLISDYYFKEIEKGLQNLIAPIGSTYQFSNKPEEDSPKGHLLQETDTFDTWFSSGQWPLTTLGYPDSEDFKYFYPTSILDTMWDILPFWVMRMLMFGIYRTGKAPFEWSHMHARVVDSKGRKMSKSKGNVVNPMEVIEEYGADALRFALIFGVAPAADVSIGDEKMVGMRNFTTKVWNISRFVLGQTKRFMDENNGSIPNIDPLKLESTDKEILKKLEKTVDVVTDAFENFRFSQASEEIYNFVWHELADVYIEQVKDRLFSDEKAKGESKTAAISTLLNVLKTSLTLLHPFIPFITEELYQKLPEETRNSKFLATENWPKK